MRNMIRRLIEDAGLTFGENVSDGKGGIDGTAVGVSGGWFGGRKQPDGQAGIAELRKRTRSGFQEGAGRTNGLRLSFHEEHPEKTGFWSTDPLKGGTTTGDVRRDHARRGAGTIEKGNSPVMTGFFNGQGDSGIRNKTEKEMA